MLAIIYDRASTQGQSDNYSRIDAVEWGKQEAKRHGYDYEIVQEVGNSSSLKQRPKLMKILERIELGEVHAVICQKQNRLHRSDGHVKATIQEIFRGNKIPIFTQEGLIDLTVRGHRIMWNVRSSFDAEDKDYIVERICIGLKRRAEQGHFNGGKAPLGYKHIYEVTQAEEKPRAKLIIDTDKADLIHLLFNTFVLRGYNSTARLLNETGYRTVNNNLFTSKAVKKIVQNPIYAGFIVWGRDRKQSEFLADYEPKFIHRADLQIVSIEVWEKAQEIIEKRKITNRKPGSKGRLPFTGFIICSTCEGSVTGARITDPRTGRRFNQYRCANYQRHGKTACEKPKTFSETLVQKAVVPMLGEVIANTVQMTDALQQSADKYGKTASEQELTKQIKVELFQKEQAKERLINSIADGVLSASDAKKKMTELKNSIDRLNRDLAAVKDKVKIRKEYLSAMEYLQDADMETVIAQIYEKDTDVFRRLMELVFEPNSIVIETERVRGNKWTSRIIDYKHNDNFLSFLDMGIDPHTKTSMSISIPTFMLNLSSILNTDILV